MVAEEIEVTQAAGCRSCSFGARGNSKAWGGGGALAAARSCCAAGSTSVGLGSGFEEIDGLVAFGGRLCGGWCGTSSWLCGRGGGGTCRTGPSPSSLSLLLLDVLRYTLEILSDRSQVAVYGSETNIKQILHSTVWIEERRPHCPINICSRETHALHIRNRRITLCTKGKS